MPDNQGYQGTQTPYSGSSEYNALRFLVSQMLGEKHTATLVKIVSVTNSGGVSPVGFVDVLPLVNQVDGSGVPTPHGVVHSVPYMRVQGGANAVILDPQIGDIGLCVFADRDISAVKTARGPANPGSYRRMDMADGMYIGGFLNAAPTQYVQFSAAGIKIHSPAAVVLEAPAVSINCATLEMAASASVTVDTPTFTVNGNSVLNGDTALNGSVGGGGSGKTMSFAGNADFTGTLKNNGVNVGSTHVHGGVLVGSSNTAIPH